MTKFISVAAAAAGSYLWWGRSGDELSAATPYTVPSESPKTPQYQTAEEAEVSRVAWGRSWDPNWDFREPHSLMKPGKEDRLTRPTATRNLYFVRHGQYEMGPDHDRHRVLTQLGKEQAALTGVRLAALRESYTRVTSSTMTRARETTVEVRRSVSSEDHHETDLLREGAPIRPEPSSSHWRPERHEFFAEGARIEAAFRQIFHRAPADQLEDSHEVYICHANVIRYLVCRALQIPPEAWLRMSLHHGSITWLRIHPNGRVSLKALGDAGHMPPDKLSC